MAIRYLKQSDPVPEGEPRRYTDSRGYVRLRWKVGVGEYVEAWEHRILAGRPRSHVHHKDHDTSNNSRANLEALTAGEHIRHTSTLEVGPAWTLYEQGFSLPEVAGMLGCDSGALSRLFKRHGLKARTISEGKRLAWAKRLGVKNR